MKGIKRGVILAGLVLLAGVASAVGPVRIGLEAGYSEIPLVKFQDIHQAIVHDRLAALADIIHSHGSEITTAEENIDIDNTASSWIRTVLALSPGLLVWDHCGLGIRMLFNLRQDMSSDVKVQGDGAGGAYTLSAYWNESCSFSSFTLGGWWERGNDGAGGLNWRVGGYAGPALLRISEAYSEGLNGGNVPQAASYRTEMQGWGYAAEAFVSTEYGLSDYLAICLNAGYRVSKIPQVKYTENIDSNKDGITDIASGQVFASPEGGEVLMNATGYTVLGGLVISLGSPRRPRAMFPAPAGAEPVRRTPVNTERASADRTNIAVAGLEAQGVSASDAGVISDVLRSEMVKTKAFNVVEKQNMDKVLAEQGFQQSGCTSAECAVKLGRILNTRKIVVGSFGKLVNKYFVSIRVVDVETGNADFSDDVRSDTVDEVITGIRRIAATMAGEVR